MIGKTISHSRIVSQFGGSMGVVYQAEDLKLRRMVLDPGENQDHLLRVGLSVEPKARVR